jgi:hypothetical protein
MHLLRVILYIQIEQGFASQRVQILKHLLNYVLFVLCVSYLLKEYVRQMDLKSLSYKKQNKL